MFSQIFRWRASTSLGTSNDDHVSSDASIPYKEQSPFVLGLPSIISSTFALPSMSRLATFPGLLSLGIPERIISMHVSRERRDAKSRTYRQLMLWSRFLFDLLRVRLINHDLFCPQRNRAVQNVLTNRLLFVEPFASCWANLTRFVVQLIKSPLMLICRGTNEIIECRVSHVRIMNRI